MMLVLIAGTMYAGRGDKAGTSAAPELLIPVGARDLGLGGSSLATTSGVEAIYWNPAGLGRSTNGTEAMFSFMNYIADVGVQYAALSTTFEGFGSIGFSLKSLSIGEIEITTENATEGTGERFSPTYVTVGLTFARQLTDRIGVGVTANLISERIDRVSATGVAFNFGVQYGNLASVKGLSVGVVVKNIGPAMKFDGSGLLRNASVGGNAAAPLKIEAQSDELPSTIEIGLAYQYKFAEESEFTFSGLFQNNNMSDDEYKIGGEYGYNNTLFVRGGWVFSQESVPNSRVYDGTAGAGVHYPISGLDLSFDYAYRAVKYFGANHVFSIKLGF